MQQEKSFKYWRIAQLEKTFNLKRLRNCEQLEKWLNAKEITITDVEQKFAEELQDFAFDRISSWSEQDLIFKLIAPIFNLIKFDTEEYGTFNEWQLKAVVNGINLKGTVDLMIATGKYEPEIPYFCLHEYKKEKGTDNDPVGQMLSEMIAAQQLNKDDEPVYGSYVLGRMWFFAVLHGNEYCISKDYSAIDELGEILRILKTLKQLIDKRVKAQLNNPI